MKRFVALASLTLAAVLCGAAAGPYVWELPAGVAAPPVPADNAMSVEKVALGRRLFYDARVSANGALSCASCHEQARGFAVAEQTKPGIHGAAGRRNPQGLANVGYLTPLTWADPHAKTLETQVATPLFGDRPVEMGNAQDGTALATRLAADACYRRMFAAAFPAEGASGPAGAVTAGNASKALAAFQRSMTSWEAPYDRWKRGDAQAVSAQVRAGEAAFERLGCASCHSGPNLTDGEYHQAIGPYDGDDGLMEKSGKGHDRGFFRTPSLRNVALTAPYLRDGRAADLKAAVAGHLSDTPITPAEMAAMEAFMGSLTDEAFVRNPKFAAPAGDCG